MSNTFRGCACPRTSTTCAGFTPSAAASTATTALFALPPLGGAETWTLIPAPYLPATRSRLEPGTTLTERIIVVQPFGTKGAFRAVRHATHAPTHPIDRSTAFFHCLYNSARFASV